MFNDSPGLYPGLFLFRHTNPKKDKSLDVTAPELRRGNAGHGLETVREGVDVRES